MLVEITPELWALFGLIIILYGLGSFIAGYYLGRSRTKKKK